MARGSGSRCCVVAAGEQAENGALAHTGALHAACARRSGGGGPAQTRLPPSTREDLLNADLTTDRLWVHRSSQRYSRVIRCWPDSIPGLVHHPSLMNAGEPTSPRAVSMCIDSARRSFSFLQQSQLLRAEAAALPQEGDRPVRRRADSTRSWQYCPPRSRPSRAARTGCAGK